MRQRKNTAPADTGKKPNVNKRGKVVSGRVYKTGTTKQRYQIEFRTPGWGNGKFAMSSGATAKKTRDAYRSNLRQLYQAGELEILQAVKDRRLALPVLKAQMDTGGVKGTRAYWDALKAQQATESPEILPLVQEYYDAPSRKGSMKTRGDYDRQIRSFLDFTDSDVNGPLSGRGATAPELRKPVCVIHFERDRISRWVRHLETAGSHRYASKAHLSPRTARHHRAALSAFCGFLMEKGLLLDNPVTRAYRPKMIQEDPVYMTREQWHLFRKESEAFDLEREPTTVPVPDTTFWKFLVAAGATTYNEGCAVRMMDVHVRQDPSAPTVRVWLGGTKTSNRQRSVWIPRLLAEEVIEWAKRWNRSPHEPIFQFERWRGFYYFNKVVDRLVASGHREFEVMKPYTLRHTYAVAMIQGDPERGVPGVDIVTLARLMGHGDNISTTMIYARHVGDYAARGSQNMGTAMGLDR